MVLSITLWDIVYILLVGVPLETGRWAGGKVLNSYLRAQDILSDTTRRLWLRNNQSNRAATLPPEILLHIFDLLRRSEALSNDGVELSSAA